MPEDIKISSIIIAKNEENNIAACIKSQAGCIDEINVLVDTTTTDKTSEIAASFLNTKVISTEWEGYAATKQRGVNNAANDWILWIDADEVITPELSEELNRFKKSAPEHAAYSVARRAWFLGKWIKHSGWYPGRVTRLFNRSQAGFAERDVHEFLDVKGTTGKLQNDLIHYTDPDLRHYFTKFNRYTSLAAEELYKKNKKAGLNDLLLRPFFIFIKMYFLKKGFLDGTHGFILAALSSGYVFTKYAKLWELQYKGNK